MRAPFGISTGVLLPAMSMPKLTIPVPTARPLREEANEPGEAGDSATAAAATSRSSRSLPAALPPYKPGDTFVTEQEVDD